MAEILQTDDWYQGVNLLGATGNVGSQYIVQATEGDYPIEEHWDNPELDINPFPHQHPTKITAIASSTKYYVDLAGISAQEFRNEDSVRTVVQALVENGEIKTEADKQRAIVQANVKRILDEQGSPYQDSAEIVKAVEMAKTEAKMNDQAHPESEQMIYVDAAVGNFKPLYERAIKMGSGVVAANKDTIAYLTQEEFRAFTDKGLLEFKTTVGAGANAVDFCQRAAETSFPVLEIAATLSGTCGKLSLALSSEEYLNGDKEFSDIARELKAAGDTEPHPHTDFSGADVMKKITILAKAAGYDVDINDIVVENPIVPAEYGEIDDVAEYLDKLKEHDASIRELAQEAANEGKVIRYVARMRVKGGKAILSVGLEKLAPEGESIDADIARAEDNIIYLRNQTQSQKMEKPGSGLEVTAEALQHGGQEMIGPGNSRRAA